MKITTLLKALKNAINDCSFYDHDKMEVTNERDVTAALDVLDDLEDEISDLKDDINLVKDKL